MFVAVLVSKPIIECIDVILIIRTELNLIKIKGLYLLIFRIRFFPKIPIHFSSLRRLFVIAFGSSQKARRAKEDELLA
jgi:hypothetical protein